jgi:hypothetical protein
MSRLRSGITNAPTIVVGERGADLLLARVTGPNVTGLGTSFATVMREKLAPQYIRILAQLHNVDWSTLNLPSFAAPQPGTAQAALWQLNWMARVWKDDNVQASPIVASPTAGYGATSRSASRR